MEPYYSYPFSSAGQPTQVLPQSQTPPTMPSTMPPSPTFQPYLPPEAAPVQTTTPIAPPAQTPAANPYGGVDYVDVTEYMHNPALLPPTPSTERQQPVLSNNPAVPNIVLFKELTGYSNYGNPSGNADILYTGNRGAWTFEVPPYLFIAGNFKAQVVIQAALDDHYTVPANNYSARIAINGTVVHTGLLPLVHGRPSGGRFNNWRLLTFDIPNLRRNNRVTITNTSSTGPNDWIAFDWMELRMVRQS